MDLVTLLIVLFVISIVAYVFFNYVPLPQPVKTVVIAFLALIFCIWLLQFAGLTHFNLR